MLLWDIMPVVVTDLKHCPFPEDSVDRVLLAMQCVTQPPQLLRSGEFYFSLLQKKVSGGEFKQLVSVYTDGH